MAESPSFGVPINSEFFLNVAKITQPKPINSLVDLWEHIFRNQASSWSFGGKKDTVPDQLLTYYQSLTKLATAFSTDPTPENEAALDKEIQGSEDMLLLGVTRALHIKIHLEDLEEEARAAEEPRKQIHLDQTEILNSKLILQSFLDYLNKNGVDHYSDFLNNTFLRLVSTVHPNETERTVNLMHYTSVLEKYIDWKKENESIGTLSPSAPEYRIRRESLNQLRRAIKAEIEGTWQANQRRKDAITVENEARRLLERYRVLFRALPMFVKFVKALANEAFWLYHASLHVSDRQFKESFEAQYRAGGTSRESKLKAIKRAFEKMQIKLTPARITTPIFTFGSWKGGDRDGNPFVVASFTNATFIEQKIFVLEHYISLTKQLIDKLTLSTEQMHITQELNNSVLEDRKQFPYITANLKPWEPFRIKICYILEKLNNTLRLVSSIQKTAGSTTRPLLSQTLPGPSGYNLDSELRRDIDVVYHSLVKMSGKSQARSLVQDIKILVDTFGLHMTSIDFRQTSEKNEAAVVAYLKAVDRPEADTLGKESEGDRQKTLISLILDPAIEYIPWIVPHLPVTLRDTFESLLIFADASRTDPRSVGKFIISMCSRVSDLLNFLLLLKIVGLLKADQQRIVECSIDVTGLFETVEDLKRAPHIMRSFVSIEVIRNYLVEHRAGRITIMVGYSDSVRDGSCLASDAQVMRTAMQLKQAEEELNNGVPLARHIRLSIYRGRGDTIPRGFGGSVSKAIASQTITTAIEDHTEQNRYLRRYASISSTIDHLHVLYSAHLTRQVAKLPDQIDRYQAFFDFFGRISNWKWNDLVQTKRNGAKYFGLLSKFSILPHLPKSNFASRPVARDGVSYNIDLIRAIPFTMFLAQMREFTTGYYGSGTAFDLGCPWLSDANGQTTTALASIAATLKLADGAVPNLTKRMAALAISADKIKTGDASQLESDPLYRTVHLYSSDAVGIESIVALMEDLEKHKQTSVQLLSEMYLKYPPFNYSLMNKEASLIIRRKNIVDDYAKDATPEERELLDQTEAEAQLAKKWVLAITNQDALRLKMLNRNFNSPEIIILHKIQARWLNDYRRTYANKKQSAAPLTTDQQLLISCLQMSILAVSEALGFAG